MLKQEKLKREKMLDPDVIKDPAKMLNEGVIKKLNQYGIEDGEFKLKMGKYHSEERRGVPFCMLIVKKGLAADEQVNLEIEIREIDPSLCVIFKK